MNIFALSKDPIESAKMLCDKHVPKMLLESVQMLSCALILHNCPEHRLPMTKSGKPYRGGYKHHPCSVWTGKSRDNYIWLLRHAIQIGKEYIDRFDNIHACLPCLDACQRSACFIPKGYLTPFAQAMPEEFKNKNAILAYRNYYKSKEFATWNKGRIAPIWWN
jgi:hypothetical protein